MGRINVPSGGGSKHPLGLKQKTFIGNKEICRVNRLVGSGMKCVRVGESTVDGEVVFYSESDTRKTVTLFDVKTGRTSMVVDFSTFKARDGTSLLHHLIGREVSNVFRLKNRSGDKNYIAFLTQDGELIIASLKSYKWFGLRFNGLGGKKISSSFFHCVEREYLLLWFVAYDVETTKKVTFVRHNVSISNDHKQYDKQTDQDFRRRYVSWRSMEGGRASVCFSPADRSFEEFDFNGRFKPIDFLGLDFTSLFHTKKSWDGTVKPGYRLPTIFYHHHINGSPNYTDTEWNIQQLSDIILKDGRYSVIVGIQPKNSKDFSKHLVLVDEEDIRNTQVIFLGSVFSDAVIEDWHYDTHLVMTDYNLCFFRDGYEMMCLSF